MSYYSQVEGWYSPCQGESHPNDIRMAFAFRRAYETSVWLCIISQNFILNNIPDATRMLFNYTGDTRVNSSSYGDLLCVIQVHWVQSTLYREGLFFLVAHTSWKKNMHVLLHFRNRGLIRGMRCFGPAGSCSTDIHWRAFASATFSVLTVVMVGEKFSDCCRT